MRKLKSMSTGELFAELIYTDERASYFSLLASINYSPGHRATAQMYAARRDAARAEIDWRGISVRCVKGVFLPAELFNKRCILGRFVRE